MTFDFDNQQNFIFLKKNKKITISVIDNIKSINIISFIELIKGFNMKIEKLIEKLSQSMERFETQTFKNSSLSDLTSTQIFYLDAIFQLKNPKLSELALYLNVSKPTVTFAINKMEKQGYVIKTQSNEDRRFFSIRLTSKGNKLAKVHDRIHKSYAAVFKKVLDIKELTTLETLLGKVLKKVQ